eukprot:5139162-Alexandrium_andersonii.AAC.1
MLGGQGRDCVKTLILAILDGGGLEKQLREVCSYNGPPPPLLRALYDEAHLLGDLVAAQFPEKLAILVAKGKSMPKMSLLAHRLAFLQRETMEKITTYLAVPPSSFERDGLVVMDSVVDQKAIERAIGMRVKVQGYPPEADIVRLLQAKFPYVDFAAESLFSSAQVHAAMAG